VVSTPARLIGMRTWVSPALTVDIDQPDDVVQEEP
jgi:hypothetical protein